MKYKDLLELISKPWIDTYGIMKLAECGRNSATKIRTEIEQSIIESGKKIPVSNRKHVPTKLVVEYLGLDINFIKSMTQLA